MNRLQRRDFIKASFFGSIAAATMPAFIMNACAEQTKVILDTNSRVSLATGTNRADIAFRALQPFSKEIAQAIGNRRVILKPNMVELDIPLCATHKDSIEGILEFYKSINKLSNVVIAESSAGGHAMIGYDNYGYIPVAEKYKVKLIDLDDNPSQIFYVIDEKDFQPKPVRMSSLLIDRNNYVMSVARMKTHSFVIATLTLKNLVFGAAVKDRGYKRGTNAVNDKPIVHGNGHKGCNYNLFAMAYYIRPDLGFVDGYEGMEGMGPNQGTPIDHKVCIAGLDWLAVERVGIELMGINHEDLGYLNYCANARMGQYDLNKIEIVGEKLANHIKSYELPRTYNQMLKWKAQLS